ncbi:MAG: molecular chaperone HscC [Clostridiales bacterium]|nr:molecular chaperone HscC [Clostridiales bacterium]
MAIIGIDLGTTNSLAAVWKDGQPVVFKNSLGDILTPSAVGIDDNGEILCGKVARERLITHPSMTAAEFKRSMGTDRKYTLGTSTFTPEQLSSLILRKIKEDAEKVLGEPIEEAVISVPAYFDDARRFATKQAASMSGLKVERLINEPSAAALAYLHKHGFVDGTYMVIDFGGGTLDVSIIDSFDSVMEILAVSGNNALGGKDFNEAIYNHFLSANEILPDTLTDEQKAMIYKMAEDCKIALSDTPLTMMSVNINDKTYTLMMDNNTLIKISHEVFEKILSPIKQVLRDARINVADLEDIILVGGSCKMPTISAYIEKVTGRKPCTDINPDTAIALGAAIFAGMKSRNEELKDIVMTDICPFSLGIAVEDSRTHEIIMDFIIPRNSMLPTSRRKSYYAVSDNQTSVRIQFFQGESIIPSNNTKLGELLINCPATPKHGLIDTTKMTYDINGILMVEVETVDGKTHNKTIISKSNRMSEAEIARCQEQLSKLTLAPTDKEENRLLIARAERAIEETLSFEREAITQTLLAFKAVLEKGNSREIRIMYNRLNGLIDKIDGIDTGLIE